MHYSFTEDHTFPREDIYSSILYACETNRNDKITIDVSVGRIIRIPRKAAFGLTRWRESLGTQGQMDKEYLIRLCSSLGISVSFKKQTVMESHLMRTSTLIASMSISSADNVFKHAQMPSLKNGKAFRAKIRKLEIVDRIAEVLAFACNDQTTVLRIANSGISMSNHGLEERICAFEQFGYSALSGPAEREGLFCAVMERMRAYTNAAFTWVPLDYEPDGERNTDRETDSFRLIFGTQASEQPAALLKSWT
ncbi:MAG: hypothetical protein IJ496_09170 [Ruminococcus sp.]|nr:hypothetical protein [Ruminococcus sp.]